MKNYSEINKIIKPYNKILTIDGDKSISIRWALIASQANGKSRSYNLLKSEDVISTLECLKKLGIKVKIKKQFCEINGNGLNGFKYKKKNYFKLGKLRNAWKINNGFTCSFKGKN